MAIGLQAAFHFDWAQMLSLSQCHATAHGCQSGSRDSTAHKDIVGLWLMMPRVHQALCQLAIIGQQQQTFRKIVKSSQQG